MSNSVQDILVEWRLPVGFTLVLLAMAAIYLRGWFAIRKTRRAQFTTIQLASFMSGLAVLWLAVGSPMDGFADALLSAHMVEHLLLMSVVPPLLLLGMPTVPLLRGLPRVVLHWVFAPMFRSSALRRFGNWLIMPVVAWLAMNIAYLGWHIPAAYDFALEHEFWHSIEHLCFLSTSILFWWCILLPFPCSKHSSTWGVLLYLIAADIINTLISAFLAFCGRPVYHFYIEHPNPFHQPPLEDQVLGAVIMWVFGSLVFLIPAVMLSWRLLTKNQALRMTIED